MQLGPSPHCLRNPQTFVHGMCARPMPVREAAAPHATPQVLINISDHVVRYRATGCTQRVLGALFGHQPP